MSVASPFRDRVRTLLELALPTLTVAIGLQTLRSLLPLIVNHYGVRPGVTTVGMGIYAFAIFLSAFLAAALHRLLGPRMMLGLTAGGLGLLRVAMQFSTTPAISLNLATGGVVLFVLFLPTWIARARVHAEEGISNYALSLLLGLTLDTALHGLYGTYDLIWQRTASAAATVLLLAFIQLVALARDLRDGEHTSAAEVPFGRGLTLAAIGPFIFLEALLFQNVAQVTTRTSWGQAPAFVWTMVANTLSVLVATLVVGQPRWRSWPAALVSGLVAVAATWAASLGGAMVALGVLLGSVGLAVNVTLVLLAQGQRAEKSGLWRTTVSHGIGMFLFALLAFGYYAGYDLSLPFDNALLLPVAAGIVALCAIAATVATSSGVAQPRDWAAGCIAVALLVVSLLPCAISSAPEASAREWPVRIMTYNLHQGFATDGFLGMEALARVIDGTGADVVALQEVSRGWYINGSLDMLPWLSRRLGMPYLFAPAADPIWGNAILSRYPILEWGHAEVPKGEGVMRRGYLWARVDVAEGEDLLLIATHLHHIEAEHEVRIPQVTAILDFWAGREPAIVLGDMNSWPDSPEMELFRKAGLRDAFAEVGVGDGFTFASNDLYERIDYLWVTPDLEVGELDIPQSTASDHLGVAVTVGR